jgi:hypothetical protein
MMVTREGVGVLEEPDGGRLEPEVGLEVLPDLLHQLLEGEPASG